MRPIELTDRERNLLILAAMAIGLGVIFFGGQYALNWFANIDAQKTTVLEERKQIEKLGKEKQLLNALARQVGSKTSSSVDITPIIENMLESNGLKDKVSNVKPSQSVVEKEYNKYLVSISIRKAPAGQVLNFIQSVENYSSVFLRVDYFQSRPALRTNGLYNFDIRIATFTREKK